MPPLTGKRSRIIALVTVGALCVATAATAATLPDTASSGHGSSAVSGSPAVSRADAESVSPAFARLAADSRQQASSAKPGVQETGLAGIRQYAHAEQAARKQAAVKHATEAKAAARAAAQRAAGQAAARKAAAAKALSGSPRQVARQMLAKYGWPAGQFSCLAPLWAHESGWSVTASNPSSGAYGIAQALPAGRMASAGADWRTSAATQIKWGLDYIRATYGSPCGAWSHEQSDNWY